jgi:asparagine synthase (glutamine-hydrolysing)
MRDLFADVLPPDVLQRSGKATFNGAFWGPRTRSFVADWEGQGVDASLVDIDGLGRLWRGSDDDYRSYMLLQSAWLTSTSSGVGA